VPETAHVVRMGNTEKKNMNNFVIIVCKVFTVTEKCDIAHILVNYHYILKSLLMASLCQNLICSNSITVLIGMNVHAFFVMKANITWLFI
jgi:Na+-transporting NADH:ubiquinone oxidoreductase subunit NqrB